MAETYLPSESVEIVDTKSFSGLSFVAFIASLVGAFSVFYIHLIPIALLAIVLGFAVLRIANRYQLSGLSKFFASAAIVIATTFTAWGSASRWVETSYDLVQAKKTAQLYLESLSAHNIDKALLIQGVPIDALHTQGSNDPMTASPVDLAKQRVQSETAFVEIRNRTTPAKWEYVGMDAEYPMDGTHIYKLRYKDVGQTNPPQYWVFIRKDCPKGGPAEHPANRGKRLFPSDLVVHWYLENIEPVLKIGIGD